MKLQVVKQLFEGSSVIAKQTYEFSDVTDLEMDEEIVNCEGKFVKCLRDNLIHFEPGNAIVTDIFFGDEEV